MNKIEKLLSDYQENKMEFEDIYKLFQDYILFLGYKYKINSEISSLMYKLWNIISNIKLEKFNSSDEILRYIYKALNNYSINLYRKNLLSNKILYNSNVVDIEINNGYSKSLFDDTDMNFNSIIKDLPRKQKEIIKLSYLNGLSDNEIAIKLGNSRQAIHKNRTKALAFLKSNALELRG